MTTIPAAREWVKSSYSGAEHGSDCLEWAPEVVPTGSVPIRDSKNPGPELHFSTDAWASFIGTVRRGDDPASSGS
ncbi:DUF397 domain-containing protein [Streptomyces gilvosporeus]|uniref:DUF397 domain-containing protein n=1 Tax=Streptomyces gilvosporeus TaxID=553510 RepID=A0A1V0TUF5_9ACTN|nr:DUF397 domain-containing protein [Streptomyces gilvosporeus]ARF56513.1 hypothetical protein B1H19_22150 [Streptomyces gilvosporeus]